MIWRCIFNDILSSMRSQCKGIDPLWLLPTHDKSYESFEYQDEFKKIYIVRKVYYAYKERMKDILTSFKAKFGLWDNWCTIK